MTVQDRLVRLEFGAEPARLQMLRCIVREALRQVELSADRQEAVVLAVNEACANIMRHAYAGRRDGRIVMEAFQGEGGVRFVLQDWGTSVEPGQLEPRPLDRLQPGGLGMHFIHRILDGVEYLPSEEEGNRFVMHIHQQMLNDNDGAD